MTKQDTFESLLNNPESSVLDFKKELYDFSNDGDSTAKFVKDIISFANTIRSTNAYIIFGIKEIDGQLDLIGLKKGIDDSILQNKVKNKVFPRPIFSYSPIKYKDKLFGLIEIPIHKYELPITPSTQLKGLEIGKVYYRNGTANTEATGIDVIRINEWLKSLEGNV
ncbi:helix-turn-helix domain-containing protein, partial [Flavobacterium sp.]